jgi:nitroreductase
VIGLSSIHWREAWKYGERAYRYCQLDVGHAIAAISYAAATLGWSVMHLDNISDHEIDALLGLNDKNSFIQAETEHPDVLLYISDTETEDEIVISSLVKQLCNYLDETQDEILNKIQWHGKANRLDRHPMYTWPIIDQVAAATQKPETIKLKNPYTLDTDIITEDQNKTEIQASQLIRQRRSAQAFDPKHELPLQTFYSMLEKLMPRNTTPWNSIHLPPRIHLVFYVHRVTGLTPGLYALPRYPEAKEMLQAKMRNEFNWKKVNDCPQHIPLYELVTANSMNAARKLSCHQPIASDSAFSVSMLAEYNAALQQGEWNYRYLHWEAGMIGQVLYLEAEAANIRGTGIGCFFDDAVHQILGIESDELQVVYHFTVGTPIVDNRLITTPPYSHLKR